MFGGRIKGTHVCTGKGLYRKHPEASNTNYVWASYQFVASGLQSTFLCPVLWCGEDSVTLLLVDRGHWRHRRK
jgi:hypothetical protein